MSTEQIYQTVDHVNDLIQKFEAKNLPGIAIEIAEIWGDINEKVTAASNSPLTRHNLHYEMYMQRISPYWTFLG